MQGVMQGVDETGWLIEKADETHKWLAVQDGPGGGVTFWTDDAYSALRFVRESDAYKVARALCFYCSPFKITEHMWCGA